MPRVRTVTWTYDCDATTVDGLPDCGRELVLAQGDHVETGRSLVVHDQGDADAAARQDGWKVGRTVLCPTHTGGAA